MTLLRSSHCVFIAICVGPAILQAQYTVTFQGPASISQDPTVSFFNASTLASTSPLTVPGAFQFLSLPDSSEFYLIANTSGAGITAIRPQRRTAGPINYSSVAIGNFGNPLSCAALSPDGSRLVVGEAVVHVFDTSTNTDLTPDGLQVGNGAGITGLAISYDSQTAYTLATYSNNSYLAAINLSQLAVGKTINLAGIASGPVIGPNGLLYVSVPNQILEINPATLAPTPGGIISVEAIPGKLVFTPDGNYALAANQDPTSETAALLIGLSDHSIAGLVPMAGLPVDPTTGLHTPIDSLYVVSSNLVYAFSSGAVTVLTGAPALYTLEIGAYGGLILNTPPIPGVNLSALSAITFSNDLGAPGRNAPQYLFVVTNGSADGTGVDNLYRIDPASATLIEQVPLVSMPGAVAYAAPTATTNLPLTVLMYGNNQNLLPGATSLPMVLRVLDQNGLPISGMPVNFMATAGSITPVNTATGADGYAEAVFTAGNTPADIGTISIIATVNSLQAAFNMNVATGLNAMPSALSIVSGQGQVVQLDASMSTPPASINSFTVLATDANGLPLSNALVTFTLTTGGGGLLASDGSTQPSIVVPTDATGQASANYVTPTLVPTYPGFASATITASAPAASGSGSSSSSTVSQNFYITTIPVDVQYCGMPPCTPADSLVAQVLKPAPNSLLTGTAGQTLFGAVQMYIGLTNSVPLPGIGLQVTTGPSTTLPNASCANPTGGGVAVTNTSGIVTCDLVLNGVPGTRPLSFVVPVDGSAGTGLTFSGYTLTIIPGPPSTLNIISGDKQNVATGTVLPQPLTVQVLDSLNNPIPGAPVSWSVLSGSIRLTSVSTITNANGIATATGLVASAPGSMVTVQVTAGAASATFTILVSVPAAKVVIVSGNNQNTQINTAFPAPIVVQLLDMHGKPAPYGTVVFAAQGAATLSASSVAADVNGQASTMVTAGGAPGPLSVIAASGTGANAPEATFTLTVLSLGPSGPAILNAASMAPGIAPGGLVTFMGTGLTPTIQGIVTDPSQMAGYSINFNGTSAPLLALANQNGVQQINAQVPFEVYPGSSSSITIQTPQGSLTITNVSVASFAPGIFSNGKLDAIGGPYPLASALRSDGSYISASNPARVGDTITIFATGLGQTIPPAQTGIAGVPGQVVGNTLLASVNNQGVAVISAVYEPGSIGTYTVTLQIPASTVPGPAQPIDLYVVDSTGVTYSGPATYVPIADVSP